VHLGEDLVEGLLLLIVAADPQSRAAAPADGIQLVDEDDRRRRLASLHKEVAHARGAYPDDRLDEFRRRLAEERHLRLARHRAREERLPSARGPDQQDAFGNLSAKAFVL